MRGGGRRRGGGGEASASYLQMCFYSGPTQRPNHEVCLHQVEPWTEGSSNTTKDGWHPDTQNLQRGGGHLFERRQDVVVLSGRLWWERRGRRTRGGG